MAESSGADSGFSQTPPPETAAIPIRPLMDAETKGYVRRLQRDIIRNVPIEPLSPEAREDTEKPRAALLAETRDILKNGDSPDFSTIKTADGKTWIAYEGQDTPEEFTPDGTIYTLTTHETTVEDVNGEQLEHIKATIIYLGETRAVLLKSNLSNSITYDEPLPPKMPGVSMEEMGRNEINQVLEVLSRRISPPRETTDASPSQQATPDAIRDFINKMPEQGEPSSLTSVKVNADTVNKTVTDLRDKLAETTPLMARDVQTDSDLLRKTVDALRDRVKTNKPLTSAGVHVDATVVAATGAVNGEIEWIPNFDITAVNPVPVQHDKLLYPGTTACPGCGMALVVRKVVEAFGKNTVLVENIGCGAWNAAQGMGSMTGLGMAAFPSMPLPSGSACATGISLGLKEKGQEDTKVVLIGGDGSLGDIGFTALSGAAERNSDFLCVTEDNEAYANTGIQRSGATPQYAWTTTTPVGDAEKGKSTPRKDMPLIIAAHRVPYVATASLAYMDDFMKKLTKARQMRGFRYIHVYTPCPTSWRFPPEKMIQVSRLGVTTGIFTLYEIEDGKLKITVKPEKFKPVADYLKLQGRFSHLTDEDIEKIQKDVDIAQAQMRGWEQSGLSLPVASG
jgi:pyruvate ferredoxin oxidoreductase beta subunit